MQMEGRMQSGIFGMSGLGQNENHHSLVARYADDSTTENPIVEVRIAEENGEPTVFRININDIDPRNATQLEMFALCSHADAQGISTANRSGEAYMTLMEYAASGENESNDLADFVGKKRDWTQIVNEAEKTATDSQSNVADVWTQMLQDLFAKFADNLSDEVAGDGILMDTIVGEERFEIESERYNITKGDNQTFIILNKETGEEYTFSEKSAILLKDK